MILTFQITKEDYFVFCKDRLVARLKNRALILCFLDLFGAFSLAPKPMKLQGFLLSLTAFTALIFFANYLVPLMIIKFRLSKKSFNHSFEPGFRELSVEEEGIKMSSLNKVTVLKWLNIKSANVTQNHIWFGLADKKMAFLHKRIFGSEDQYTQFLHIVQKAMYQTKGIYVQEKFLDDKKPPYLWGIACILPGIGGLVGLALLITGITKYRDKWLACIGVAGIIWSIIFYSNFPAIFKNIKPFKSNLYKVAQLQLNSLPKNIEYYKLTHGQYPDSLNQLLIDDKLTFIIDPTQTPKNNRAQYFNYQKVGTKYTLFSSGLDGKPKTKDDLFPQIKIADTSKFGLVYH